MNEDNKPEERKLSREEARKERKAQLKQRLEQGSLAYKLAHWGKKYLDDYYLDPILGFILPGVGDAITASFSLPLIYLALFKIRSIPLALALAYNVLLDWLLGMLPFFIGDLIDLFNKAYKRNYSLVVGFLDDDQAIIREVRRKSAYMAAAIVVLCLLIYLAYRLLWGLATSGFELLMSLF